ncbi:Glyoxalase domain-containing protein 4 [Desmophyllum pertusum]|uniref:Glyoxalase domain-containing protein 4 n=1 Tax=Desmophyllum pertusum TaxID=174260 RepID=A0A9W9ZU16_9CNID|nr:Glyoxalase domain-containing protein 4 [Desmophyllum pertusum]
MSLRRALHFVFKIGNRNETVKFYREILGMKVLRHEEFEEGCKASCNGPYDGKWSKTMAGLDLKIITLLARDDNIIVEAPGGYKFTLVDKDVTGDPVKKVSIGVSSLAKSLLYWQNILGMTVYEQTETKALLGYDSDKCKLELIHLGCPVDHATAFGRIAFSLDTPGKATVEFVILADPDGHEICFVGDEAFRELSKVDPNGDKLLNTAMAEDKSDEWFAKVASRKKWTP